MAYSIIGLPCFSFMVFSGAGIGTPKINQSKIVKYAVDISYVFYFAQFFTWQTTLALLNIIETDTNVLRILVSFILCTFIAIVMHEIIEKPLKLFISKKFL